MLRPRAALLLPLMALAAWLPVSAQTVISTHSGVLYFFEGSVFLGDQQLEQKFGKFPDIGQGRELRTEHGRAEVLLTPGVFLRIGDNSSIRMISESLADTRVELLTGSAIVEVNQNAPDTSVTLVYKDWQVRAPQMGVYRIDSEPPQLQVFKGEVDVAQGGKDPVAVKDNESLPLSAVLVPEPSPLQAGDPFKTWAMNRSQAVSADNAIAGEIVDDPNQMDASNAYDPGIAAGGGFTYFPLTGVPSLGIVNPYGVSFWSPYQATLNSMYFPMYLYAPYYIGWPSGSIIYPRSLLPGRLGGGTGLRLNPVTGRVISSPYTIGVPRTGVGVTRTITVPRPAVSHPVAVPHAVGAHR